MARTLTASIGREEDEEGENAGGLDATEMMAMVLGDSNTLDGQAVAERLTYNGESEYPSGTSDL
jgi:hypothetical protein